MVTPFPPSLWADVTAPRMAAPALDGTVNCDVAVIGAGFTGLSTALHLLEHGRKVVVIEAVEAGWGASGRNNGQVIPTMTGAEPDAMARLYGEPGEHFARLVSNSASRLFNLIREHGLDCEASQTGWFQPAHSPGRVKLSAARVEAWGRRGAPVRLLDARETADLIGSKDWFGGMLNTSGGHINPLAFARELARLVTEKGASLFENTPAEALIRTSSGWEITTPKGRVRADQVMLATNGYTDWFAPTLSRNLAHSLIPILSWQMATAPQPEEIRQTILPGRQALSDTHGDLRFFRWDARGRLVTGGALICPYKGAERLRTLVGERLGRIFPQMGVPRFDYVWNGRLGMTHDRMPRFHQSAPGLWTWVACNGRGVALGTALGSVFAKAITGTDMRELPLPFSAVRPYPFHAIGQRVAPAMLALYRWRDGQEMK